MLLEEMNATLETIALDGFGSDDQLIENPGLDALLVNSLRAGNYEDLDPTFSGAPTRDVWCPPKNTATNCAEAPAIVRPAVPFRFVG